MEADFVESTIIPTLFEPRCLGCSWDAELPLELYELNEYMLLLDAGCPVERHELTNQQWLALGTLKRTRAEIEGEEAEQESERQKTSG